MRPRLQPCDPRPRLHWTQALRAAEALPLPRRSDELADLLLDVIAFQYAAERVSQAKGWNTPGVDGRRLSELASSGLDELAGVVHRQVRTGQYEPSRLRRVTIQNGRRTIGIPTAVDRVVQHALGAVLEGAIESRLGPYTYGARQGFGLVRAIEESVHAISADAPQQTYVLRLDIRQFFDQIVHDKLLGMLDGLVGTGLVTSLLREQLRCWAPSPGRGIPQGAPLSPALANLYLADLDAAFEHREDVLLVRYLDDLLVLVDGSQTCPQAVLAEINAHLDSLSLDLNVDKTSIGPLDRGFVFLGLRFTINPDGTVALFIPESRRKLTQDGKPAPLSSTHIRLGVQAVPLQEPAATPSVNKEVTQEIDRSGWRETHQPVVSGRAQSHPRSGCVGPHSFTLPRASRALGRLRAELTTWKDYWGAELQRIQEQIQVCNLEMQAVRARLLVHLADVTNVRLEQALAKSPAYQSLVAARTDLKARATEANQELAILQEQLAGIDAEMLKRCEARGIKTVLGRAHLTRQPLRSARRRRPARQ